MSPTDVTCELLLRVRKRVRSLAPLAPAKSVAKTIRQITPHWDAATARRVEVMEGEGQCQCRWVGGLIERAF